jgi:hypothetical protein
VKSKKLMANWAPWVLLHKTPKKAPELRREFVLTSPDRAEQRRKLEDVPDEGSRR